MFSVFDINYSINLINILDPKNFLIKEALSILVDKLTSDEKDELKDALNLKDDILKWRVEWKLMEPELQIIGREDLIEEIKMKTDITVGKKYFVRNITIITPSKYIISDSQILRDDFPGIRIPSKS